MATRTKSKKKQTSDQEFPTDWDIDAYRTEHECEEHWQLRRRFMEVHKEKFSEDELVCLAAVFTNMEFLGCKYPTETMQMVGELAKDVAKEFRAERANRLKRTFVAASDAAEARAKGRKKVHQELEGGNAGNQGPSTSRNAQQGNWGGQGSSGNNNWGSFNSGRNNYGGNQQGWGQQRGYGQNQQGWNQQQQQNWGQNQQGWNQQQQQNWGHNQQGWNQQQQGWGQTQQGWKQQQNWGKNQGYDNNQGYVNNPGCGNNYDSGNQYNKRKRGNDWQSEPPHKRGPRSELFEGTQFGNFVLYLNGGRNCLRLSAQRCNMQYEEREVAEDNGRKKIEIYLNNNLVTSACEDNIKASKAKAFNSAMEILRRNCYSIKPNPYRDTIKINKTNNQVVLGVIKQAADTLEDKKIDASNKGFKMMKSMGWTGGGLGSKTQGREEPVGYLLKNNRAGLGNAACKLDRGYFTQLLQNYIESEDIRELQFEPTFTKDERAMLHEIAGKFNLKSNSYGRDDDRRLVISKKNISNEQILNEILIKKSASYFDKYSVQVPESKARQHPEHTETLELDG